MNSRFQKFMVTAMMILSFAASNALADDKPSVRYSVSNAESAWYDVQYGRCLEGASIAVCECAAGEVANVTRANKSRPIMSAGMVGLWRDKMDVCKASNPEPAQTSNENIVQKQTAQTTIAPATPASLPSDPLARGVYERCSANAMNAYYDCTCTAQVGLQLADTERAKQATAIVDRAKLNLARAESPTYRQPDSTIAALRSDLQTKQAALSARDFDYFDISVSSENLRVQAIESGQCKSREGTYRNKLQDCQKYSPDEDCECRAQTYADLWMNSDVTSIQSKYVVSMSTQASQICRNNLKAPVAPTSPQPIPQPTNTQNGNAPETTVEDAAKELFNGLFK